MSNVKNLSVIFQFLNLVLYFNNHRRISLILKQLLQLNLFISKFIDNKLRIAQLFLQVHKLSQILLEILLIYLWASLVLETLIAETGNYGLRFIAFDIVNGFLAVLEFVSTRKMPIFNLEMVWCYVEVFAVSLFTFFICLVLSQICSQRRFYHEIIVLAKPEDQLTKPHNHVLSITTIKLLHMYTLLVTHKPDKVLKTWQTYSLFCKKKVMAYLFEALRVDLWELLT